MPPSPFYMVPKINLSPFSCPLFHLFIKDVSVFSRTGLRAMLVDNFTATAEFDLDWDNTPSPGFERIDTRYLFNLAYGW